MLSCIWKGLQDCPKKRKKLESLDCFHRFYFEYRSKYVSIPSTDHSSGERLYEIIGVHLAKMTGDGKSKQTRTLLYNM